MDEPTNGLHLQDIQDMISLFDRLVERGNTVYVIEHNLDVLKAADYAIELGPSGGESGGEILFSGRPKLMLNSKNSVTAPYLKNSI